MLLLVHMADASVVVVAPEIVVQQIRSNNFANVLILFNDFFFGIGNNKLYSCINNILPVGR